MRMRGGCGVFGVNVNDRIDILGVEVDGRRRGVKGRKILMLIMSNW